MKIESESYRIWFDREGSRVVFEGALRLSGSTDYKPIHQFLLDVHELDIPVLTLDFKELEFLNSSGISTLCRFVFDAKKRDSTPIRIIGTKDVLWQTKSFSNLQKLWDKIELDLV